MGGSRGSRAWIWVGLAALTLASGSGCTSNDTDKDRRNADPKSGYVALGDSFSAGEGAGSYDAFTDQPAGRDESGKPGLHNHCHRSGAAYPQKVLQELGGTFELDFRACSGATTQDFYAVNHDNNFRERAQRAGLDDDTKLVTATFGGNDAGFAKVVSSCADFTALSPCVEAAEKAIAAMPAVYRTLKPLYADMLTKAPNARILILGYPRLFPQTYPGRCSAEAVPGTDFAFDDQRALNDAADLSNRYIARAITELNEELNDEQGGEPRLTYVDVSDVLAGHDLCAPKSARWINKYVRVGSNRRQSFHPNALGHTAFAERVLACYQRNECEPKVQPDYTETYRVDLQLVQDSRWIITWKSYTISPDGLRVEITYQNRLGVAQTLFCPMDGRSRSILTFSSGDEYNPADDYCSARSGQTFPVAARATHTSWGLFKPTGMYGGEFASLVWYGMGPRRTLLRK